MRKLAILLLIAIALIIGACEGPVGPPGQDGDYLIGSVFEFQEDFTPGNNYSILKTFPNNVEVYESDVVLVYILWETDNGLDVWRLMPQTVFIRNQEENIFGEIIYNYDYTYENVRVFLEFTINEEDLLPSETDGQWFRVAVVPADIVAKNDFSNFNSLLETPELKIINLDMLNSDLNSFGE